MLLELIHTKTLVNEMKDRLYCVRLDVQGMLFFARAL